MDIEHRASEPVRASRCGPRSPRARRASRRSRNAYRAPPRGSRVATRARGLRRRAAGNARRGRAAPRAGREHRARRRPDDLQAELRVPETQARDVQIGQVVSVDTRNGLVEGKVVRIDPAVQAGTVLWTSSSSASCRAARARICPWTARSRSSDCRRSYTPAGPAYGQPNTTIGLFKLVEDGVRGACAGRARPHVGERGGDRSGLDAGGPGDSFRHVGLGRSRSNTPQLI